MNNCKDYTEDFNRYRHIIHNMIQNICPKQINNEDLIQDLYADMIEYMRTSKSYNLPYHESRKFISLYNTIYRKLKARLKRQRPIQIYDILSKECSTYSDDNLTDSVLNDQLKDILHNAINRLSDREANILKRIYFDNATMSMLADEQNITPQRISEIHVRALHKLRHPIIKHRLDLIANEYMDIKEPEDIEQIKRDEMMKRVFENLYY